MKTDNPWAELQKLKRHSKFVGWGYLPIFVVLVLIVNQFFPRESLAPVILICFIAYSFFSSRLQKRINYFVCPQCSNLFYKNRGMFNSIRNNCSHCDAEIGSEISTQFELINPRSKYTSKSFFGVKVFGAISLIMGLGNFIYAALAYFQPELSVNINGENYYDKTAKIKYMLFSFLFIVPGAILLFFPKVIAKKLEGFIAARSE